MPDTKLSGLPTGSAIADADLFYSAQGGASVRQPASAITSYVVRNLPPVSGTGGFGLNPTSAPYNASGSASVTTGSITAGTKILTLSNPIDFRNGQGIRIFGAGAAYTLPPPTTIGRIVAGTGGSTTYNYQVASVSNGGSISAPSAVFPATGCNATLDAVNYNLMTWSIPAATSPAIRLVILYRDGVAIAICTAASGAIATAPGAQYNDKGFAFTRPEWLPSGPVTTSTAEYLNTVIESGGGTSTLTLRDAASTTVTGVTVSHDDTLALQAAFDAARDAGLTLLLTDGTYFIGPQQSADTAQGCIKVRALGDVSVWCTDHARLKCDNLTGIPLFAVYSDRSEDNFQRTVNWSGGTLDSDLGCTGLGSQACSCFAFTRIKKFRVTGTTFYAGQTYPTCLAHTDSGITSVGPGIVTNCYFIGQGDNGVYVSGGGDPTSSTDDSNSVIVANCVFQNCANGVAFKREIPRCIADSNYFEDCGGGVVGSFASGITGHLSGPGRQWTCSNNIFKRVQIPITVQQGEDETPEALDNQVKAQIIGNKLIDFAYIPNTTGPILKTDQPTGILLQGAKGSRISNNIISFEDWDGLNSAIRGVFITPSNYTGSAQEFVQERTIISDNDFINVYTAIRENIAIISPPNPLEGTYVPGPTLAVANSFTNVHTRFTPTQLFSVNQYLSYSINPFTNVAYNGSIRTDCMILNEFDQVTVQEMHSIQNNGTFIRRLRSYAEGGNSLYRWSGTTAESNISFGAIDPNTTADQTFQAISKIFSLAITNAGTGGPTDPTVFEDVALTGGSGTGGRATISVEDGSVQAVELTSGGVNYATSDVVSASSGDIGGTTGVQLTVTAFRATDGIDPATYCVIGQPVTSFASQAPTGLIYNYFPSTVSGGSIIIRCANVTGGTITPSAGLHRFTFFKVDV